MTETARKELRIGEILRVEIEKVAHGGHFIARYQGAVIFVRHAIPGELVEIEITSAEKSLYRADVVAVIEASQYRVSPPCRYAGICGGCDFLHIDTREQRSLKSDVISEQYARIAKMEVDVEVEEVSQPLQWRTRYAASTDSKGEIGFKAARSNEVIPISTCPIVISEIDFPTLPMNRIKNNQRVEVALDTDGNRTISQMNQRTQREDARGAIEIIEGEPTLHYSVGQSEFNVSHTSFWQSNINAPARLVAAVMEYAQPRTGEHLLDLYGGVGLFAAAALPSIGAGGRIDIVEGSESAIKDAESNFLDVDNVHTHCGDVAKIIRKFKRADLIILDPPRTGATKSVIERLVSISARAIIYIACDPAALARDTVYLREGGYSLTAIRAFDLFPMTHHIESIALFTPNKVS